MELVFVILTLALVFLVYYYHKGILSHFKAFASLLIEVKQKNYSVGRGGSEHPSTHTTGRIKLIFWVLHISLTVPSWVGLRYTTDLAKIFIVMRHGYCKTVGFTFS